ncbi:type I polyketide synthase [Streptomyces sp. NPDC054784]
MEVDWSPAFAACRPNVVDLPTYAFQRQRFWLEVPDAKVAADPVDAQFWETVEREDLEALAGTLGITDPGSLGEVLPALSSWRRDRQRRATLDSWRYRIVWRPRQLPKSGALDGDWLLVVPAAQHDHVLVGQVREAVAAAGARVSVLTLDASAADDGSVAEKLQQLLSSGEFGADPRGIVSLLALDEAHQPGHEGVTVGLALSLAFTQGLLATGVEAPIWMLTTESHTTGLADDPVHHPMQAAVWGFGRVVALEHPALWGGLVDLPAALDDTVAGLLTAKFAEGGDEDQVALRPSGPYDRRLVRTPRATPRTPREPWRTSGSALITGGTGGLGAHTARLLARRGAEHLVLTSRRGMDAPGAAELRDELTALGARVTIAACDVTDRAQVRALVEQVEADGPAFRTVVHTAGYGLLVPVADVSMDDFDEGARAKLLGAQNLDVVFDRDGLDAFVLYSSVAGVWGSGDHGAYAASNAYVDALADHRRARGLAGTTIPWGIWSPEGGGMAVEVVKEQLKWRGIPFMDAGLAVQGLEQALDDDETFLAVADIDWPRFVPVFTATHSRPLLHEVPDVAELMAADEAEAEGAQSASATLQTQLLGMDAGERERTLVDLVRVHVAGALGFTDSSDVSATRAFKELGFDSLTAVELRNRLNAATGLKLAATVVFDYPNVRTLAGHLAVKLIGDAASGPAAPGTVVRPLPTGTAGTVDDEPIAIVAMSCRFPGGVQSPEDLWRVVRDELDVVSPLPTDRGWDVERLYDPNPDTVGTTYAREGGFLEDAGEFDAAFFGISPREALAMDPQQRLLLETSWEALERAGIDPKSLHGTATGVFVGAAYQGYGNTAAPPEGLEGHLITGTVTSIASGRISYTLGLEGPAVTMDTGCSSSLVATHLAVQALRSGECTLALAGAAAVMGEPIGLIGFSRQRGLARDGRCKAFAASADGMGMAEGAGMIVLERLSDARANGHQVLGVVRGSAINQDGASNGLTAPNGPSQQRVIRAALANAGLEPGDVDAVEAHGTGTKLGDPIEAQALLATYGEEREAGREPLWLGSVKSNIGHAQAASGVAGVIKMIEAFRHGLLPRSLHLDEPSPHVDWSSGAVELLAEARPWERNGHPRRVGVSSFGVSGTNAHLIIEEPPEVEAESVAVEDGAGVVPWLLSARSAEALREQAQRLAAFVEAGRPDVAGVGHALLNGRAEFEHRAVVAAADVDTFVARLGEIATGTSVGVPEDVSGRGPVFVFPGQGAQWVGMGRELLDSSPVFKARFAECDAALAPFVDWSLSGVLRGVEGAPGFDRVDVVQPVLWAVMVSLAEVWRSYGVQPAAVVGHSQGEIAAACVSGALSIEDAARVVALRSQTITALAGRGGMVSVAKPRTEVDELIAAWDGRISVAAVNGPSAVVVSGDADALDELRAHCDEREIRARRIEVDYASHSAHVESIRDDILTALAPVRPCVPSVPFFSTVTGAWLDADTLVDADYWYTNLRQTVQLEPAVRSLIEDGHRAFAEMSPHPVLTVPVQDTAEATDTDVTVTGTLRRDEGGLDRLYASLGHLWAHGVEVDWSPAFPADRRPATPVDLPTYPFQRQHYWLESTPAPAPAPQTAGALDVVDAKFWETIESEDIDGLASEFDISLDRESLHSVVAALSSWRRERQQASIVDGWRYRVAWRATPASSNASLNGTWLVVVPDAHQEDPLVERMFEALAVSGAQTQTLVVGKNDADRDWLADRLRTEVQGALSGILSLVPLDERRWREDQALPTSLVLTTTLLQALGDAGVDAPLWCATRGAVTVSRPDTLTSPTQAMTWGLGRIAAFEYPQRWGGLIDLPEKVDHRAARRIVTVLSGELDEDQVAVRPSGVFARRMLRAVNGPADVEPWRPTGTVLVTGGTGGLGGHVARWLARGGADHVVLASRRGADAPGAAELVAELGASGTAATAVACDVADRAAVDALLADLPGGQPLTAVVHTAGIIDDGMLDALVPERAAAVLRPKVDAAQVLHEATRHLELSAFVLFSSMAGTLGGPGQGSYAAANAYLDGLAERRRADGLPATSVAWGAWAGGGLVDEELAENLRHLGVPPMDPGLAISALQNALDQRDTFVVVADVDWRVAAARVAAALRELPEAQLEESATRKENAAPEDAAPLVRQLAALSAGERRGALLEAVRAQAAAVLGFDRVEAVPETRAFRDLGFESLTAVELRNRLGEATGLRLPVTMAFDHPTASALATFLHGELFAGGYESGATAAPVVAVDRDPVVIVGMGCRFPGGVRSPEDLWRLVADGTDAIGPFPENRGWDVDGLYDPDPDKPGTFYSRDGGFLYEADHFDPAFFGISPREALAIDPQHRLLLETAWEAFERAGIDPVSVRGTQSGVFVGSNYNDYGSRVRRAPEGMEGYLATGSASSVASGRIAYTFGLEGPAVTVDTACSSSLVALHQAAQALRSGECSMALAGGVTVISTPDTFIEFSRQRALAPDGRCKAFSADADGAGWAEGVGLVLLERLSDARANGHRVLAVVKGSAVNQDGASNGLTAPNGPSQQRVIRAALGQAGLEPGQVDAVEAHGTGTSLGDPIEAQALMTVYGQGHTPEKPLWLGAVKSNIGHTQAASGIAGVIKMVMSLAEGALPRTLHADEVSPHIDWSAGTVRLLQEQREWARTDEPRRAGVSAFGISGTNAHVILEEAGPEPEPAVSVPAPAPAAEALDAGTAVDGVSRVPVPWLLSGRGEAALREQAARLGAHLAATGAPGGPGAPCAADVALSLATTRAGFEDRAAVIGLATLGTPGTGASPAAEAAAADMAEALAALAAGTEHPRLITGRARGGKTALLFTGQGAQRAAAGRRLYDTSPVFADALDEVCAHLDAHLDTPLEGRSDAPVERQLREVLFADPDTQPAGLLDRTAYTQAGLFALEVALYRLLESYGTHPDYLLGHSVGELAAAHVAGVLSLDDACALVAARGRLMQALPGRISDDGTAVPGAMVSVQATEDELLPLLEPYGDRVSLAALNGPRAAVLSGDEDAVTEVAEALAADGRKTKRLTVSHAFHSAHMDGMLEEFGRLAGRLTYEEPRIPVVSNVTGRLATGDDLRTADYWVRHVRQAVRFHDGVRLLAGEGVGTFVELGPDGVLTAMAGDCLAEHAETADAAGTPVAPAPLLVPLLRRGTDDAEAVTTALARLHVHGHGLNWAGVLAPLGARTVDLPTYPFQQQRYWLEASDGGQEMAATGLEAAGHPLLAAVVPLAGGEGAVFTGLVSVSRQQWLADHAFDGNAVFPGTAFLELALQACERVGAAQVEEFTLEQPLILPASGAVQLQLAVQGPDSTGGRAVTVHSRPDGDPYAEWTRHATGVLTDTPAEQRDLTAWPPPGAEPVDVTGLYEDIAARAFDYGPAFRGLTAAWRDGGTVYAEVALDQEQHVAAERFALHPALLDAALHTLALAPDAAGRAVAPFSFTGVALAATGATALRVRLTPHPRPDAGTDGGTGEGGPDGGPETTYGVQVTDTTGAPVATVGGLALRAVGGGRLAAPGSGPRGLHRVEWTGLPLPEAYTGRVAVVGAAADLAELGTPDGAYATVAALGAAVAAGLPVPETVLAPLAPADDGTDTADAVRRATARALAVAQDWLADERFADSRLVLCTRGAVAPGTGADADAAPAAAEAAVWGLLRAARTENPGRFALLDHDGTDASYGALNRALATGEPESALRDGALSVPRLVRVTAQEVAAGDTGADATATGDTAATGPFTGFTDGGTVLVTGASGMLGKLLARHLVVAHGVRSLLLASRRGAEAEGMPELCAELRADGAEVTLAACDVADRAQLTALLDTVPDAHPLTAVFHTAGVLDDGVFEALTPERLEPVLRAKVDAVLNLDDATRDLDLSAFVLYSSLAGTLGGAGQANYSAANAFLDAHAARLRAHGRPATSLGWGLWAERSGMTGKLDGADLHRMARGGVRPMATDEALALLDAALATGEPHLVPAQLDIAGLRAPDGGVPHLLHRLAPPRARRAVSAAASAGPERAEQTVGLREQLAELPLAERPSAVLDLVLTQAALVLGHASADALDPERGFLELGFDSLTAVELRNRLGALAGVRLPATLLFDYPSPPVLAAHLLAKAAPPEPSGPTANGTADASGGLLGGLDTWEAEFDRIVRDDAARTELSTRLQTLLDRLGAAGPAEGSVESRVEGASDDELFDFIDNELGGA